MRRVPAQRSKILEGYPSAGAINPWQIKNK
jgi:hypothetical protein